MARPADTTQPDGPCVRDHLLAAARMGSQQAQAELAEEPELPPEMEYLVEWAGMLVGRSGVGMDGAAPLSFGTLESYARLSGVAPDWQEVVALMELDTAMRTGRVSLAQEEPPEAAPVGTHQAATRQPAWPTRKVPEPVLLPPDQ